MKTKIVSFILAIASVICLASCGVSGAQKDEIKNAAAELIEKSYEINVIYFGEGLAASGNDVVAHSEYEYVADEAKFHTIEEVKTATAAVYSSDYCNDYLFLLGFEGLKTSDDATVSYPKYLEDTKGKLTVRKSVKEDAIALNRTYDYDSIKVESYVRGLATITVQSFVDGEKDEKITLTLVKEAEGWRLNSPTY